MNGTYNSSIRRITKHVQDDDLDYVRRLATEDW